VPYFWVLKNSVIVSCVIHFVISKDNILNKLVLSVLLFFTLAMSAFASPYGTYDPKLVFKMQDSANGKSVSLDPQYLDQMIRDLVSHAMNYPPSFDSEQDKQRAVLNIKQLTGMLEIIFPSGGPNQNPEVLQRMAVLNRMGHNLDIEGCAAKADVLYKRALVLAPTNPRINFEYGAFLAGVGKPADGIPYLETALKGKNNMAAFSLGMAYLAQGDKTNAQKYLEIYAGQVPNDPNTAKILEAIKSEKIEFKRGG
jgi:tetratricopeptide (TPR) repeat protein